MKYPIRILHVIGIMDRGGAESMIMNLYRNIDRSKIQFDFVEHTHVKANYDDEIISLGGKIYRCPKFKGFNILEYQKWWKNFWKENKLNYNIVHGHIGSTAAIYLKIAKQNGIFTIAHSHSTDKDISLKSVLYKILSYNTRNVADYFFTCSNDAGISRFGNKVTQNHEIYKIFHNAIDTDLFQYDETVRCNKRSELQLKKDNFVIGHIGRFTPEKNHQFIISVFEKLSKQYPQAILLLVGDGPLKKEYELSTKNLENSEKIRFMGVRSDVNELMQAMDVLIFPSKYEGLPVTLIEAQASGLPCVISDRISEEVILCKDLLDVMSLDSSIEDWSIKIIAAGKKHRTITTDVIKENGYDIKETSKWLEEFYETKAR